MEKQVTNVLLPDSLASLATLAYARYSAIRTYPASGASVMLPLTPANNYTATVLFCGGQNLQAEAFNPSQYNIASYPADTSCVSITPDLSTKWTTKVATLPEGRTMGNFILLPDGTIFLANGGRLGTAGYGTEDWTLGDSYATSPILQPLIYDPATRKFTRTGMGSTTIPRLYHSTAVLLPDGAVLIAGSNPHPDYTINTQYPTEYRTERFYPSYYASPRPEPSGLLSEIGYGGWYFNVSLSATDLANGGEAAVNSTKVVIIRTGFSTHGLNMGQRLIELDSTYTYDASSGSAILHVAQLPPNPAVLAPGPAVIHVVVGGVPSVGRMIMVGSGRIGVQGVQEVVSLPEVVVVPVPTSAGPGATGTPKVGSKGAAGRGASVSSVMVVLGLGLGAMAML